MQYLLSADDEAGGPLRAVVDYDEARMYARRAARGDRARAQAWLSRATSQFAALGMSRARFKGQDAVGGVIALPLVVPEIVTAVATLLFFVLIGIRLGLTSLIIAHTVFCVPFAYLPVRARLEGMDPTLEEAAADLYAAPLATFRRVTLPLLWPGILSGAMLAFIISLADFVISYFVAGAGSGILTATGRVSRRGARIAFARGEARDADGRLVATAQGTWYLWPHRPPAPSRPSPTWASASRPTATPGPPGRPSPTSSSWSSPT